MDCLTTLLLLLLLTPFTSSSTVKFEVYNNCSYTVWAAATPVGGGQRLDTGQSWIINVPNGTKLARIWGRTNCNFDSSGRGSCETGDCGGALQCTGWGKPPNTLAEFALSQFNNLDFFDISNVDGFNVPMSFAPTRPGADKCHAISCPADIVGQCPDVLRVPGGCNNPCTTFGGTQYCCTNGPCGPTDYSKFFKGLCPDAYSYPQDDATSTFTCPGGTTDYRVVFCPKRVNKIKMSYAANIEVLNNCPFTVWAAATPVGGGQRLDQGQNWTINIPASSSEGRVWGRTNCNFDSSGRGSCQTGDCGGVLQCTEWGKPPNTRVEYSLKQLNNLDVFDISLIDGFNIPLSFSPTKPTDKCHAISCTADIVGQCPAALRDPGGCNNPCTTFQTPEYCCIKNEPCGPTDYSRFFKGLCPDAFSYSRDDATSTFTCPGGTTDYRVVFCP